MAVTSLADSVRVVAGPRAHELYLTLAPEPNLPPQQQAAGLYSCLRGILADNRATLFCERIFGTAEGIAIAEAARGTILGQHDDGVAPTRVVVPAGRSGQLAGLQVHAVAGPGKPQPVRADGQARPCGRRLEFDGQRWLMLNGIYADAAADSPAEQAGAMFENAAGLLRGSGADMHDVARTWLWLKEICAWYGELNAARTAFFKRQGLIRADGSRARMPASTGIGVDNAAGRWCVIDLLALPGNGQSIRLLEAGGEQNSAFAYGSAFSRAAIVPMPAGPMLLISGTAAIDPQGRTEHVGQIDLQIEATIRHIRALLAQAGCGDEQVLSALVYCKTPQVQQAFHAAWSGLGWPSISMIAEVCRQDLLFEIELVAGPVTQRA